MMIHEKMLSGQFLVDFKNDHSSLLPGRHPHQHLDLHRLQQPLLPQISSPLDIYSAYNLQQLMGVSGSFHQLQHQSKTCENNAATEVLDLSRRYDPQQEARRKTPSPYNQSASSNGYNTPAASPLSDNPHQQHQAVPIHHPYVSQSEQGHSLHPIMPYISLKREHITPPPVVSATSITCDQPVIVSHLANPISKTPITPIPTDLIRSPISCGRNPSPVQVPTTPTSTDNRHTPILPLSSPAALPETKSAPRPFKAFPRDPLVIAATFAATDVLLDNPRVERYTEYRKRVLEQIRTSNGGTRTVTNPKMRRVNSRNGSVHDGSSSNHNSESDERNAAEESSDCDSNAGNFEKFNAHNSSRSEAAAATAVQTPDTATGNNTSQVKDAAYYERRRKNNAAAKKSRDRRRIKEDEIAIRAAYLERQNIELLCQIDALKAQLATFVSKNCS